MQAELCCVVFQFEWNLENHLQRQFALFEAEEKRPSVRFVLCKTAEAEREATRMKKRNAEQSGQRIEIKGRFFMVFFD